MEGEHFGYLDLLACIGLGALIGLKMHFKKCVLPPAKEMPKCQKCGDSFVWDKNGTVCLACKAPR